MGEKHVMPLSHRWAIDQREITRHEQRRGRKNAFERLDPQRTAPVVVDLVRFFVEDSGYARGVISPVNATASLVRQSGGTVAWVVPAPNPGSLLDEEFYGQRVAAIYAESGGVGPVASRLWPELDVSPEDLQLEKSAASAFFPGRCGLHKELQERQIDSVLIAGTVADVCCESSVRDARTLGYRVVMLADANAAPSDAVLNATLRTVYRSFGDVRPTHELRQLFGEE